VTLSASGMSAFFLHCDAGVKVHPSTHSLLDVAGKPFDPERSYTVAIGVDLGVGSGQNLPLLEFAKANAAVIPDKDEGIQARDALEIYFLQEMWKFLPSFDEIDSLTCDGYLTFEEIKKAYMKVYVDEGEASLNPAQAAAAEEMVHHLIRSLDKAGDSRVSRAEYAVLLETNQA